MSDLISRKMVMKYLQEQQANVIIEKAKHGFVSEEVCDGMHAAVNAFINFIVQAPTIEAVPVDRNKIIDEFVKEVMREFTVLELHDRCPTVTDCKIILRDVAEKMKGGA